jgi:hypothetical protein
VAELKRQLILIVILISIFVNQVGSFWRLKCVIYGVIIGVSFCWKIFTWSTHTHTQPMVFWANAQFLNQKLREILVFEEMSQLFDGPKSFLPTLFLFVENFGWFFKSCHQ